MNKKIFQKRLKALRLENGLDIRQMELLTGLRGFILGFEQGEYEPTYCHLRKISTPFKVSVEYLLGETDEKEYRIPMNLELVSTEDLMAEIRRRIGCND